MFGLLPRLNSCSKENIMSTDNYIYLILIALLVVIFTAPSFMIGIGVFFGAVLGFSLGILVSINME